MKEIRQASHGVYVSPDTWTDAIHLLYLCCDQAVFSLMSRGLSEAAARAMIVNGFANPISKELPVEYAVEMNHLIQLEMEGAIG